MILPQPVLFDNSKFIILFPRVFPLLSAPSSAPAAPLLFPLQMYFDSLARPPAELPGGALILQGLFFYLGPAPGVFFRRGAAFGDQDGGMDDLRAGDPVVLYPGPAAAQEPDAPAGPQPALPPRRGPSWR